MMLELIHINSIKGELLGVNATFKVQWDQLQTLMVQEE